MKGKFLLLLFAALLAWPCDTQAQKIKGTKTIYMFGVSMNLKDSVTCISTPQPVEGAQIADKGKLLVQRTSYTQQYKAYIDSVHPGTNVYVIFFATSQKDIERQWNKVYNRNQKEKEFKLQNIPLSDFSFKPLNIVNTADAANEK